MIPTLNAATAGRGLALPEFVQLAKKNGFSGIEFSIQEANTLVQNSSFEAVAALFEEAKVLPIVFGLPVEWRKDEDTFQVGLAELPALAKLAQDLDCSRCTTWVLPDSGEPVTEYAERSIRRFQEIGRVLTEQGVRLGLEFLGPKHFRHNPENVWFYDIPGALQAVEQIVGPAQLENVGLLIDSWHWYTSGGTPMDLASIPIELFVHVHINDAPNVPRDEQVDQVRLLPGASGVIDITAFLKTLNALGYDGPLAVETFSEELRALSPDDAAAQAGAAVAQVMQQAGVVPVRLL
ncbi:MAG: sugar phosphate isomerase/epimerase [Abitibacteriaceae bacterium]|nr:sugar phosphate isomerase/epimerase [Abditibacteriaceae bacterium]